MFDILNSLYLRNTDIAEVADVPASENPYFEDDDDYGRKRFVEAMVYLFPERIASTVGPAISSSSPANEGAPEA